MSAYIVFRLVLAFLLGTVVYIVDRYFGTRLYRFWYDLTHEHPMSGEAPRGFVANRPAQVRAFAAVAVATALSLLAFIGNEFHPLMEMAIWMFAIPSAFLGLSIGPRIFGLWQKRDTAFDAVDKWERGEINLTEELKAKTAEVSERLRRTVMLEPDPSVRPHDRIITSEPDAGPKDLGEAELVSETDPGSAVNAAAPAVPAAAEAGPSPATTEAAPSPEPAKAELKPEDQDPQELVNRYLNRGS